MNPNKIILAVLKFMLETIILTTIGFYVIIAYMVDISLERSKIVDSLDRLTITILWLPFLMLAVIYFFVLLIVATWFSIGSRIRKINNG